MAAGRVVQREGGDVELTLGHRAPLLARLEQRLAGIDLDLEPDVRLGDLAGKDLHHFIAHIALAARPLVRRLENHIRRMSGRHGNRHRRRQAERGPCKCLEHVFLPNTADTR